MTPELWSYIIGGVITVASFIYAAWASHAAGGAKAMENLLKLNEAVNVAVRAADSFYQKTDEQKYSYVFTEAKRFMADRGISIPDEILRQLIEGAVELVHRAQAPKSYAPD